MKAVLRVRQNLTLELDGEKQRDLFRAIASAQEVFGERRCGKCGAADLQFRARKNRDDQEFFEVVCLRCRAVLEFGCHKTGGTLFPRRKADDGRPLPDGGWARWEPPSKGENEGEH
jgi:hypothetical protein